jgi:hypothetical protein
VIAHISVRSVRTVWHSPARSTQPFDVGDTLKQVLIQFSHRLARTETAKATKRLHHKAFHWTPEFPASTSPLEQDKMQEHCLSAHRRMWGPIA